MGDSLADWADMGASRSSTGYARQFMPPVSDPTRLPPPKYTKARADAVYGEAFRRAMEFVVYQAIPGDVLEFGTLNGYTARVLAELMCEVGHTGRLMLFDSFEGMPEAHDPIDEGCYERKAGAWAPGTPRTRIEGVVPRINEALSKILGPERVTLVPGWYSETMGALPKEPPSIVHLDCDLYSSTKTVLDALVARNLVQDGMILLCDDWNSSRGSWLYGERRAVLESKINTEGWLSYGWHGCALIVHV